MTADEADPSHEAAAAPSPSLPVGDAAASRSGERVAVSVVIPTYNSVELLRVALDALAAQTLPADQFEVIVVDDGSTDSTWEYLTARAREWPNLHVIQQPPSGSPSVGRNRGLGVARGTYVFFHDADDYLAPDALRRMVKFADQHGSDVVVGRVKRVGRPHTARPFRDNIIDADVIRDRIWRSLAPQKLFRRDLIDRLGVTFPEDQVQGEDQVFVATCLFGARRISLLQDDVYYFRRTRDDGQNVSSQAQTLTNKLLTTTRMAALIVANTAPGERRDALFRRVLLSTLSPALNRPFLEAEPEERERFLSRVKREVLPHLTEEHLATLQPMFRLRMLTARAGTAEQLLDLNRRIAAGLRYRVEQVEMGGSGDGKYLCFDFGPDLNALLPAFRRRAEGLVTPAHRVLGLRPSREGVQIDLKVSSRRVHLDHVALVAVASRRGAEVLLDRCPAAGRMQLTVRPADFSAAVLASGRPAPKAWNLLWRAYQQDVLVAMGDLAWPEAAGSDEVVGPRHSLLHTTTVAAVYATPRRTAAVRLHEVGPSVTSWRRRMGRRARRLATRLIRSILR